MADRLDTYRRKRDLERSPEPGEVPASEAPAGEGLRFVVQEHHARRLHWDFRLERDGVLVSWAVPRGIPPDPGQNHLAVRTEDHPLAYADFEGEIPAGAYGAGTVSLWDRGTYECHKWRENEVMVTLHGERVRGRYVLFHTRAKDWMIHRMDPPQDPDWVPMPETIEPMLAELSPELPSEEGAWAYEIKWDGVRALVFSRGGHPRVVNRGGTDVTSRYPELRGIGGALGATSAVLDGEIVALDAAGRPSFQRLQRRMHLASDAAVRRAAREVPASYVAFDLLYLDGRSLMERPYAERRALLEGLALTGPSWQTPAHHRGDGAALLEASRLQGLEGVVAKRLDAPYEPGRRSGAWLKVKNHRTASLVVGGWVPGEGSRRGRIGALLVGYHPIGESDGGEPAGLRYAGRVGTGFTERELERLTERLAPLAREDSPFADRRVPRDARFVEPRLVARIEFSEWTHAHTLRQPSYKGLQDDIDAADVVVDPSAAPAVADGPS